MKELSKELTKEFGKGFSFSNLQFMRRFYQSYQIQQTVSVKLSWSHYCELLTISDPDKRSFYEKETINSGWSIRELKRQISTSLYERLLLSEGKTNKETVLALAEKGIEMSSPLDMIKDPYVFEFLGVPENKPMLESDLEKALVTPEAAGQLNMYLNYYAAEVNDEHDNPPIGIILCTDKDSIAAEYALGGLSNNIFASRYVSYIPDKEQLIAQVEAVLNEWHNSEKNKKNGHLPTTHKKGGKKHEFTERSCDATVCCKHAVARPLCNTRRDGCRIHDRCNRNHCQA